MIGTKSPYIIHHIQDLWEDISEEIEGHLVGEKARSINLDSSNSMRTPSKFIEWYKS